MTNQLLLASLLGDNPGRLFTTQEVCKLMRYQESRTAYQQCYRLREAGMNIKLYNNTITFMGIQNAN